jgi:hypothetical protein
MKPSEDSADKGAGSGCMARLVRIFGLSDMVPRLTKNLVCPVGVGCSVENLRVFVEFLPHDFIDVVSKPINHVPHVRRHLYDALGYESLHNAISDAEIVGLRLLSVVEPENLLFFFGEPSKARFEFRNGILAPSPTAECSPSHRNHRHNEEARSDDQSETQPRAIVLCKLNETNLLKKLLGREQQYGSHDPECYQVTWGELQELKDAFQCSVNHVGSEILFANVMRVHHYQRERASITGLMVELG